MHIRYKLYPVTFGNNDKSHQNISHNEITVQLQKWHNCIPQYECTYGGYYGLVVVTPRPPPPRPQTFHRSHDNLKNPYRIASIFYM